MEIYIHGNFIFVRYFRKCTEVFLYTSVLGGVGVDMIGKVPRDFIIILIFKGTPVSVTFDQEGFG